MTDNFKEIGSLFGREGAGAGFAKQTDKGILHLCLRLAGGGYLGNPHRISESR